MAIVAQWSGQGLASGTALTTSTAGADDNPFNQVSGSVSVQVGEGRDRPEIRITNDATASQFRWNGLNLATWGIRLYFRSEGHPASSLASIVYVTHSGGRLFTINYNPNGTLTLLNASGSFVAASTAIALGQMYRVEVSGGTSGNIDLRVYACSFYDDPGTPFWERQGQAIGSTAAVTQTIFGRQSGGAYGPGFFSELALADTAGEIGTADEPPEVDLSNVEVWYGDGTSFRRVECLYGTGTTFTRLEVHWPVDDGPEFADPLLSPFSPESIWKTSVGEGRILGSLGAPDSGNPLPDNNVPWADLPETYKTLAWQFRNHIEWIDADNFRWKRATGQLNYATYSTPINYANNSSPEVTLRPVDGGTWGPKSSDATHGNEVTVKAPASITLAGDMQPSLTRVNYSGTNNSGGAISFTNLSNGFTWQPDGFMSIINTDTLDVTETYKTCWWPNTADPRTPYPSSRVLIHRTGVRNTYSLTGDGWTTPSGRASRMGFVTGLIRTWEIEKAAGVGQYAGKTPDPYAIRHALAVAMPLAQLLRPSQDTSGVWSHPAKATAGYQWPSRGRDGHAEQNTPPNNAGYGGQIRMGMQFVLDPSYDIEADTNLSAEGKALAYALRDYGCYVCDASAYVSLYAEQGSPQVPTDRMKVDWQQRLIKNMVPVMNNSSTAVGGPGDRVRPPAPPLAL